MTIFDTLRSRHTLVVDDDQWVRDSLRVLFEAEGCPIAVYETAEEALAALKREPCDIIIFDYRLPLMDGLAFIRQIPPSSADAIKVLISAYMTKELISKARQLPVKGFLAKPFQSETLLTSLSFLIHQSDPSACRL
jgi:DNA-binding NtrC family response regulator